MSSGTRGRASALPAVPTNGTPAEADQWEADAVASIEAVATPEDAETLLMRVKIAETAFVIGKLGAERERRWKALRLKAERRYGELLGPPTRAHDRKPLSDKVSPSEKKDRQRARQVAAVPEPEFNAYVESEPEPSRSGLLRKASPKPKADRPKRKRGGKRKTRGEPTFDAGDTMAYDDDVLDWVRRRYRAGWTRERIIETSRNGEDGWPGPAKGLGDGGSYAEVRQAIYRIEQAQAEGPRRSPPKESGKRLRQLHADKRAGHRDPESDVWKMQVAINEAVGVLERIELPDVEWSEDVDHILNELVYDLERHRAWSDRQFDAVWAHIDDVGRQRKLHELRKRADDSSSTQSERESAANLAEKLERKYREQKAMEQ